MNPRPPERTDDPARTAELLRGGTVAAQGKGAVPGWDDDALRNPHSRSDKAARVEAMFDAIAPTYERVNSVASLGRDAAWRRELVRVMGVRAADVVLDVACGTGDVIRTFAKNAPPPARIIGADFSAGMLAGGHYEGVRTPVHLIRADALRLPIRSGVMDIVTCAFGVRNFQDTDAGLSEFARVLRPGGRVGILEFATPSNRLLAWANRVYCNVVLPRLGAWIARDHDRSGAYRYLPRSIQTFDTPQIMCRRLVDAGFSEVRCRTMNLGGVALYTGVRSGGGAGR
ncbi:MAG: ubiquinone/menaquinone biosynthesis methyltransferase [Phycisphaerales bacterium]|nr:ubiquinone/menaquinone biosynthesis methyltransferase [Phycisphaerales bacterium]